MFDPVGHLGLDFGGRWGVRHGRAQERRVASPSLTSYHSQVGQPLSNDEGRQCSDLIGILRSRPSLVTSDSSQVRHACSIDPTRQRSGCAMTAAKWISKLRHALPLLFLCLAAAPALAHEHDDDISEEDLNAPVDVILWIHMFLQAAVWGFLFPVGMVLGLSRSRWHVPLQVRI